MITRCVLDFHQRLSLVDFNSESVKALLEETPECCPFTDCTPGGCRKHCRDLAVGQWAKLKFKRRAPPK
jgi:hypothetical protein